VTLKDDLIERAKRFAADAAPENPDAAALVTELLSALQTHEKDAIRALWSVVKSQGGYARIPKLFINAMGPNDRLDVTIEPSGEAVIYKALSSGAPVGQIE
jgi:hypothetical protein